MRAIRRWPTIWSPGSTRSGSSSSLAQSECFAAGVLFGVQYSLVNPYTGFIPGLKAFTAAVLGGIGNLRGALLGGLILGVAENYGQSLFGGDWPDGYIQRSGAPPS